MKQYFVIYFGEDGMILTPMDEKGINELLEDVKEQGLEHPAEGFITGNEARSFSMDNGNYPLYKRLIIEGKGIMPIAAKTITEFKL